MPLSLAETEAIAARAAAIAVEQGLHAAGSTFLSAADAKLLVAEAVKQTLTQIGIDTSNPLEMQQDFQHLRAWRKSGQDLKAKGLAVLLGIFLTGIVSAILLGIQNWKPPHP